MKGDTQTGEAFFDRKGLIRGANLKSHQKHFLHVLADYQRWNEWAWPSQKTLAADVGVSVKRIQQVIDELTIVRIVEVRERERHRSYHEYRIDFYKLAAIQRTRQAKPTSPVDVNSQTKPASSAQAKPASPSQTKPASSRKNQEKESKESSPSKGDGEGWRKIEKQLRDDGVRQWRQATRLAREAGSSPADIQAVIDYFRSRRDAWESPAGALFHRVSNATPDQRPDDPATWMPFKPAFVRREQSVKESQTRAAEAEQQRLEANQRALERQHEADELKRLEDQFGAECDRLTASDVRQIATQDSVLSFALAASNGDLKSTTIRRWLLKWLAQQTAAGGPATDSASGEVSSSSMPSTSGDAAA